MSTNRALSMARTLVEKEFSFLISAPELQLKATPAKKKAKSVAKKAAKKR